MHYPRTIVAALLAASAAAGAQTNPPDADPTPPGQPGANPALRYWAAWNSMDAENLATVRDWNFEEQPTPTFGVSVALAELQPEIIQIVEAAEADGCDWGIDWSGGWETLLPHLGHLRRSCQLLRADARRLAAAGMTEDSVRRVEAIFEISADSYENPVLISSLVGVACASVAVGEVEHMVAAKTLTPAGKTRLLAALKGVDTGFGILESIERERVIVDEWLLEKFPGEDGPAQLAEYMREWSDEQFYDAVVAMTPAELRASVDRASDAYDEIVAMWNTDNAAEKLAEFAKQVEAGERGVIARSFLPSVGRVHDSQEKIKAQIAQAIERLEAYAPAGAGAAEAG
jgi:hypothetical protein